MAPARLDILLYTVYLAAGMRRVVHAIPTRSTNEVHIYVNTQIHLHMLANTCVRAL